MQFGACARGPSALLRSPGGAQPPAGTAAAIDGLFPIYLLDICGNVVDFERRVPGGAMNTRGRGCSSCLFDSVSLSLDGAVHALCHRQGASWPLFWHRCLPLSPSAPRRTFRCPPAHSGAPRMTRAAREALCVACLCTSLCIMAGGFTTPATVSGGDGLNAYRSHNPQASPPTRALTPHLPRAQSRSKLSYHLEKINKRTPGRVSCALVRRTAPLIRWMAAGE